MLTGYLQQFVNELIVEIKKAKDIGIFLKENYNIGIEDLHDLSMTDLLTIQDEVDLHLYKMEAK